jgi:hypothetical protein
MVTDCVGVLCCGVRELKSTPPAQAPCLLQTPSFHHDCMRSVVKQ